MLLNLDREDEGFREGLRQVRVGDRKDHRTQGLLKAALLPFDHSRQSYMKGLNRGFAKGPEEVQLNHKVTPAPISPLKALATSNPPCSSISTHAA